MSKREGRKILKNAKSAGEQYARDTIDSDHFRDWVWDQIYEASRMDPSQVLPLETKDDAEVIAENTLQQLRWGTEQDLTTFDILEMSDPSGAITGSDEDWRRKYSIDDNDVLDAFFEGFDEALHDPNVVDWLADELLEMHAQVTGAADEARETREKPSGSVEVEVVPHPSGAGYNLRRVGRGEFWNGDHWLGWPSIWWGQGRWETESEARSVARREGFKIIQRTREAQPQPPRRRLPPSKDIPIPAIPQYEHGDPKANFAIETLGGEHGRRVKWRFASGYYATLDDAIAMAEHEIGFHDIGWYKGVRVVDVRRGYKPVWEWPERKGWFGREGARRPREAPQKRRRRRR